MVRKGSLRHHEYPWWVQLQGITYETHLHDLSRRWHSKLQRKAEFGRGNSFPTLNLNLAEFHIALSKRSVRNLEMTFSGMSEHRSTRMEVVSTSESNWLHLPRRSQVKFQSLSTNYYCHNAELHILLIPPVILILSSPPFPRPRIYQSQMKSYLNH